jgi:hypothetical protein
MALAKLKRGSLLSIHQMGHPDKLQAGAQGDRRSAHRRLEAWSSFSDRDLPFWKTWASVINFMFVFGKPTARVSLVIGKEYLSFQNWA